jgi:hypothetical protein
MAFSKTQKGCFIGGCVVPVVLLFAAVGGCYWLASQAEKRPKAPGQQQLEEAEEMTKQFRPKETFGNTAEAAEIAKVFTFVLRATASLEFPKGSTPYTSLTEGRCNAYCYLSAGKCGFLIRIPDLRNFTAEEAEAMSEDAWRAASDTLRDGHPEVTELAIGIKGLAEYSWVLTGRPGTPEPLTGITQRYEGFRSETNLYPYFAPSPRPPGPSTEVATPKAGE